MKKKSNLHKKWHSYFANILAAMLEPMGFKVETEVEVGKLPLKIDVVVVKKGKIVKTKLPLIFSNLNNYNIIEYKSPEDVLDIDSFDKLFAYALLYKIKQKIGSRAEINTYAYVSGDIEPIRKYILANNHKLEIVNQGIYYSNFGFNFYLIKIDEVPEKKEYIELLLFARRDKISDILYASLFSENPISKEVLKAGSELYPEILEEVLNMTKTLEGDKKVIDKVLKIFVNSVGERKIVDLVGEQKIVDLVGEQKLIQELKKRLSKKDLEKLLIES